MAHDVFGERDPRESEAPAAGGAAAGDRQRLQRCYRELLLSESGRVVLADLQARFRRPPGYRPGEADALHAVWRDGQRSVIDYLDAMIGGS